MLGAGMFKRAKKTVTLLSNHEIALMRKELTERDVWPFRPRPPKSREYWDVERIVATLEYFQVACQELIRIFNHKNDQIGMSVDEAYYRFMQLAKKVKVDIGKRGI